MMIRRWSALNNKAVFKTLKNTYFSLSGTKEQDQIVLAPLMYAVHPTSFNHEDTAVQAFNYWLKVPKEISEAAFEVQQLKVYNTLVITDDIYDNSSLRNGAPAAHTVFGLPRTINAAAYEWFIALEQVLTLNHPKAVRVFAEHILEFHRGVGMEIYWREKFICPTEAEWKSMTIQKLVGYYNLPISLLQLFSDFKADFTPLIKLLSLYFQMVNDYSNFCVAKYSLSKGYCEDLTEGKFGFPVVHAIQSKKDNGEIADILRQRTTDIELKKHCVKLMDKIGSFAYVKKDMLNVDKQVRKEVDKLNGNPELTVVLDEILDWIENSEPYIM